MYSRLGVLLSADVSSLLGEAGANEEGQPLHAIEQLVKGFGAGTFNIVSTAFVYIFAVALLIGSICMLFSASNPAKRAEHGSGMVWRIVAGILGFAVSSIILLAQTIGSGLVG